ncbi:MAG: hypothetical protein PHQ60_10280 [Sideroxydans sp.]|nr:hypothetical protein [Sideroxydans sp.]
MEAFFNLSFQFLKSDYSCLNCRKPSLQFLENLLISISIKKLVASSLNVSLRKILREAGSLCCALPFYRWRDAPQNQGAEVWTLL